MKHMPRNAKGLAVEDDDAATVAQLLADRVHLQQIIVDLCDKYVAALRRIAQLEGAP
jgi:hypothetical protein